MRYYNNTDDIRSDFNRQGSQWFSPGNMRFFKTRLGNKVYGGCYFVSSEEDPNGVRRYSVRKVVEHLGGKLGIETQGVFHDLKSRDAAHKAAKELAQGDRQAAVKAVATVDEVAEERYQTVRARVKSGDCVVCGARLYRCDCPDEAIEDTLAEVF